MSGIKVGDVLDCIDDHSTKWLTRGRQYTVLKIHKDYQNITVEGDNGQHIRFDVRRFIKVEKQSEKTMNENTRKALEKMREEVTKQFGQPPTREEAILILEYIDKITGENSNEETRSRSD